jgi:hypothetical protein
MTEGEWQVLVETPGLQALHQARELLARERADWEWANRDAVAMLRWATAVVVAAAQDREADAGP